MSYFGMPNVKLCFLKSKLTICWIWTLSSRKKLVLHQPLLRKYINLGVQISVAMGKVSAVFFFCFFFFLINKKCSDFGKKLPCLWASKSLKSHLFSSFKSILEEKFSMQSVFLVCRTWSVYRSASIARNLFCPKNSWLRECNSHPNFSSQHSS